MKRRGGSGKPRKRRAVGGKPRKVPIARASIADLQRQLDQRTRDRDEALEQRAATAEILSLISNSPTDTQPVFKTMLAKAVELCGASFGAMWLVDGKGYRTAAMHGDLPQASSNGAVERCTSPKPTYRWCVRFDPERLSTPGTCEKKKPTCRAIHWL